MSNTIRKARKRTGVPFFRAPKAPTPIVSRSGLWRLGQTKSNAGLLRPTRLGVLFGVRDLGWQPRKAYINDKTHTLTRKAVAA